MDNNRVLLVTNSDDHFGRVLHTALSAEHYQVTHRCLNQSGIEIAIETTSCDLILLEANTGQDSAFDFFETLFKQDSGVPVICFADIILPQDVERLYSFGAKAFLIKPVDLNQVYKLISLHISKSSVDDVNNVETPIALDTLSSDLKSIADKVSYKPDPVLIFGEQGAGKKTLAKYIHSRSNPSLGNLVTIDCHNGDSQLEDFISKVSRDRNGKDESLSMSKDLCFGGSLLLLEAADMSNAAQRSLLKFIVEEEGYESFTGNVPWRILVTTENMKMLKGMVEDGEFMSQLFFKLQGGVINAPPLRERVDVIESLVRKFAPEIFDESRVDKQSSAEFLSSLEQHCWPGNVMELEGLLNNVRTAGKASTITIHEEIVSLENKGCLSQCGLYEQCSQEAGFLSDGTDSINEDNGNLSAVVRQNEFDIILTALTESNGSRKETCGKLGIKGRTLRYKIAKMKQLGYSIPDAR